MAEASSGASAPRRSARSTSRRRGCDVQRRERPARAVGARRGERAACRRSPRVIGPVRAARMPRARAFAERPFDERSVDRQGAGLVETGDAPELGDRVEQRDEAAGGKDGGRVVRRLGAGGEADRGRRRWPRPSARAGRRAGRRPRWRSSRRGGRRRRVPCRRRRPADGTRRPGSRPPSPARGPPHRAPRSCGPSPGRCTSGAGRRTGRSRRPGRRG